jgi:bis(5'-nucleosyl)-tetraphosphatase (symmetrical)
MRRIFIGDVQGCLGPLERLLEAVEFDPGSDVLHPTGDLVNKGPDSLGVLRLLRDLDAEPVLGNHDLQWLRAGRIADRALSKWLGRQPVVRLFDDVILVHAGLHPRWDEEHLLHLSPAEIDYAVTVRYCAPDGSRPVSDWPPPPPPYEPWDTFYRGAKTVVFGHWARRGLDRRERVLALDSGCVYGGKLSAWIAEEDRIVQVPGL